MTPFEKSILDNFTNGEFLIQVIRKYNFEQDLSRSIDVLNEALKSHDLNKIPQVSGSILTTINDTIRKSDKDDKPILEELSKLLFEGFVETLKQSDEGQLCLEQCTDVIRSTCELKRYDFEILNSMLKFSQYVIVKKITKTQLPYYDWRSGYRDELDDLANDLRDKKIIHGVLNFKRLFSPITLSDFKFIGSTEKIDHLVVLFSILKDLDLIKPKVLSGHFTPLERYGYDNNEKLFRNKPNKIFARIKNDTPRYNRIQKEMKKCITMNCPKSIKTVGGQ